MRSRSDQIAAAWDQLERAGRTGPLDERTCRLLELALAIGARDREAIRAAHRRCVELGVLADAIEQIVAVAAPAIGKSAVLATCGWLGLGEPAPPASRPPSGSPVDA
jgi:alkylhydroperoxidase/carboxymuconolactone decarboxylase family protein YurZ